MALAKFIQKKGSVGASTFQGGRYGTLERARIIPTNPRSLSQQKARSLMSAVASEWRGLTEPGRQAWNNFAKQLPGNLLGFQAYVEVNGTLVTCGLPKLEAPPALPAFGILACTGLLADETPSVKLSQVASTVAPDKLIIRATATRAAGRQSPGATYRLLKVVDGPKPQAADIDLTAEYTAKFGAPKAGDRLNVEITPMITGIKGIPLAFGAMVVAAQH